MLVVIAVVGIMAAIAVAIFGGPTDIAAKAARDRSNAKNLVSVYQSAQTSGVEFYAEDDLETTVDNIVTGATATSGVFSGTFFGVPRLDDEAKSDAMQYLTLENEMLIYTPNYES